VIERNQKGELMADEKGTGLITRPPAEVASFDELTAQVHKLDQFYRHLMTQDTDYGVLPGTKKPSLYKAGAELLRIWAGLSPQFEVNSDGSNLEAGIFSYEVKCSLSNDQGRLIGEGVGNCNSLESKYRFRWAWPSELPANFDKENAVKKTVKLKNGNQVTQYQVNNPNPQDLGNTILKMAKKRAFVDAILTVTGASRIFTQDVEDLPETGIAPIVSAEEQKPKEAPKTEQSAEVNGEYKTVDEATGAKGPRNPATAKTVGDLLTFCKEDFGMTKAQVLAEIGVKDVSEISQLPAECYTIIAAVREQPPKDADA